MDENMNTDDKKRTRVTELQKKKLQQEVNSCCPFCGNAEAATWEFHHINGDRNQSELNNLILVCGSCHNRITKGEISEADVRFKKNMILSGCFEQKQPPKENLSPENTVIYFGDKGVVNQNVYNSSKVSLRVAPALDSFAANADARNTLNAMVKQLAEYRVKGNPKLNYKTIFPAIHKDLARHFGATSSLNIGINHKQEVFDYLQKKIDATMQGRINKGFRARKNKKAETP